MFPCLFASPDSLLLPSGAELLVRERERGGETGEAKEVGEDAPQAGQAAGEHGDDAGEAVLETHGGRGRALR